MGVAETSWVLDVATFRADSWRGAPGGWRVAQAADGRWWWITPDGQPTVLCGVREIAGGPGGSGQAMLTQLEEWGFNVLGPSGTDEFTGRGLPHLQRLDLRRAVAVVRLGGALLPDVFAPDWVQACRARVAAVNNGRGLIGYIADEGLRWAQPPVDGRPPARPTLLQLCLALDASYAAYHAAWEFALAPCGGELSGLNRVWDLALPNKETLRQQTLEERPITTAGYLEDNARFTREFVQRYLRGAASAVRETDPGKLFFGARLTVDAPEALLELTPGMVDVALVDVEVVGREIGPCLVDGYNWTRWAKADDRAPELSELERMLQRGRSELVAALQEPGVVGYLWSDYRGGARMSEAPFGRGLVYEDGTPAHEHVQPLAAINAHANRFHAGG